MAHLLQGLHIAVTRPAEQALSLCEAIAVQGGQPIAFPLIAITPLPDYTHFEAQLNALPSTDWAIFISTNAVEYAMPRVLQKFGRLPSQLQFAAIGPQTAQALAAYGVLNALIPQARFDSESLLTLPAMQAVAGKTVAIFRGLGGRDLLAESLSARGAQVYFAESYCRINPQTNTAVLDEHWQQHGQLDAIVITSSEAMRNFLSIAQHAPWLSHTTLCVNHERIADEPRRLGLKVLVADAPGDAAMLQCLSQLKTHHD